MSKQLAVMNYTSLLTINLRRRSVWLLLAAAGATMDGYHNHDVGVHDSNN